MKPKLTQELLHSLFDYQNGELIWKDQEKNNSRDWRRKNVFKSRTPSATTYKITIIDGYYYPTHRAIYVYHYGEIDDLLLVDHIDANRQNNDIHNLRLVTPTQNQKNKSLYSNNTSGVKGVSWQKTHNLWAVAIFANGKYRYRAKFKDLELAELVAIEARDKYHGTYARNA